ncbi:MAG: rhodanese-like domain-containing protein [Gammaproteobacteria bacterium]|nr:rhodanese-like domain-containing protein [Gammaproteobacteria bacterium]
MSRTLLFAICFFVPILSLAQSNDNEQQLWHLYFGYVSDEALKNTPEIRVSELLLLSESQRVLVDVREKNEIQVSIIPGALTQQQFEQNIKKYQDTIVVVYCTIGYRSGRYVNRLRKKNIDAYNLAGGVLAWAHAGQFFSHNGQKSKKVHVYGEQWNLLPSGYEAVYEKSWF